MKLFNPEFDDEPAIVVTGLLLIIFDGVFWFVILRIAFFYPLLVIAIFSSINLEKILVDLEELILLIWWDLVDRVERWQFTLSVSKDSFESFEFLDPFESLEKVFLDPTSNSPLMTEFDILLQIEPLVLLVALGLLYYDFINKFLLSRLLLRTLCYKLILLQLLPT
jgi:hypothetical protein